MEQPRITHRPTWWTAMSRDGFAHIAWANSGTTLCGQPIHRAVELASNLLEPCPDCLGHATEILQD